MAAERIIGVDFGTSTSVIRVKRYENGEPIGEKLETKEVIFNNSAMVPTLVMKKDEDESVTYYGHEAQKRKTGFTNFHSFKVDLESADPEKCARARKLTEEFFRFMAKQYAAQSEGGHLGNSDDKERTIISYPVKWSDETKQFMIETAKKVGFPNVSGMDEAQAAIHAVMVQSVDYLKNHDLLINGVPANVLLIDMGAGTTDLVLCRLTPGDKPSIEVLDTWPKGGDILFGGREIDSLLQNFFRNKMNAQAAQMVFSRVGTDKFKSWKEEVVSPALRKNDSVSDFEVLDSYVQDMGIDMEEYCLDRAAFEDCLKDYLRQLPKLIEDCLEDAGMGGGDVDLVIVTGGHSQWYFVKEMLVGKMLQFGDVGLTKIKEESSRIIPIARPQETVALGLVYSPLIPVRVVNGLLACVQRNGKWGSIDKTGSLVIPCQWDDSYYFSEGLARVEIDGKYGYIDKTGHLVTSCQWDETYDFSEGLAMIEEDGKCGYIDKAGKVMIPCQWDWAGSFSNGLAMVEMDGKYGYINKVGKVMIPCQWDDAEHFLGGFARVEKNGKYGFIDKTGKLIIFCQWDDAEHFWQGFARVKKNDRYGYIDQTGKLVSACQWEDTWCFSEGYAWVKKNGKYGYIDQTGKLMILCQWDWAGPFSEGFANVKKNGKGYGYIDKTGKVVISCQWDDAEGFLEGLARVKKNGKYGYIDQTGKQVIPCQWDDAEWIFSEGFASVKKEDKWGFIDKTGKQVSACQWDDAESFGKV